MHSPRTDTGPAAGRSRRPATGAARTAGRGGPARRPPLSGIVPQLTLVGICAAYAVGAASGWGSPRMALIMGDFGLSLAALLAAASCLWYARVRAGEFRVAWALFGLSSLMVALGNGIWGWYEVVLEEPVPRISAADLCFLLFAPLAIIGLLMLAKHPVSRAGWICLALDASLIGGSLLTLSWSVALTQTTHWQDETAARAALALAYPLLDIALVSMVLVLHFRRSTVHRRAINTALGAFGLTVLCDALFSSPMLREQYSSGQLLDAGWFAGSLLLACAPWTAPSRPATARAAEQGPHSRPLAGSLASLMPYLAAAVCTLSILFTAVRGREIDRVVVVTACAVVLALVVRQGIMLQDNINLTKELAQKESHFRSLVQGSSDVIMIAAPDGTLRYISPAAAGVYGLDAEILVGQRLAELIHPEDLGRMQYELRRFLAASGAAEGATRIECRVRHGAGHWLHVESSVNRHHSGLIFNSRDVTERVRLQAQLQHSASHDPLTDLPNRALFTERVRSAIGGDRGRGQEIAVFYVDLDGFKAVNDTAGHQTGDELLVQAARRLRESVRAEDTTARLGGDEFAALLARPAREEPGRPREIRILEIAERVRAALSAPYRIGGREIKVAASIGIAFAEPDSTPVRLLRNADLAMYRAKQTGKGRVELYRPQLAAAPAARGELAVRLRNALQEGELTLLHQPVVQLEGGTIAALSVQARWQAGASALATPLEPLRDAPDDPLGRTAELGRRLLEEAVARAGRRRSGGAPLPVTVRLAGAPPAGGPGGAEELADLLERHALPPQALTLELAAGSLPALGSREAQEPVRQLGRLRSLGVGIALDGLGSDRVPLSALHRLPLTEVRLARELVHGLLDSPAQYTIAAALLRLAAELDIRTVADGVDLPAQAAALRAMGCVRAQGAALCEPLDDRRLEAVLRRGRIPVPAPVRQSADGQAPRTLMISPRPAVQP